jgi:hypothetical protein
MSIDEFVELFSKNNYFNGFKKIPEYVNKSDLTEEHFYALFKKELTHHSFTSTSRLSLYYGFSKEYDTFYKRYISEHWLTNPTPETFACLANKRNGVDDKNIITDFIIPYSNSFTQEHIEAFLNKSFEYIEYSFAHIDRVIGYGNVKRETIQNIFKKDSIYKSLHYGLNHSIHTFNKESSRHFLHGIFELSKRFGLDLCRGYEDRPSFLDTLIIKHKTAMVISTIAFLKKSKNPICCNRTLEYYLTHTGSNTNVDILYFIIKNTSEDIFKSSIITRPSRQNIKENLAFAYIRDTNGSSYYNKASKELITKLENQLYSLKHFTISKEPKEICLFDFLMLSYKNNYEMKDFSYQTLANLEKKELEKTIDSGNENYKSIIGKKRL